MWRYLLFLTALTIVQCKNSKSNKAKWTPKSPDSAGAMAAPGTMDGKWKTECALDPETSDGYLIQEMIISGTALRQTQAIFADPGCTRAWSKIEMTLSFTLGPPVPGLEHTKEIDLSGDSAAMTALDSAIANVLSNDKAWGYDDWTVGVPKKLEKKIEIQEIVQLLGSSLQFGKDSKETDIRPTTLGPPIFHREGAAPSTPPGGDSSTFPPPRAPGDAWTPGQMSAVTSNCVEQATANLGAGAQSYCSCMVNEASQRWSFQYFGDNEGECTQALLNDGTAQRCVK
jgi:hypothetical protein